MAQVCITGWIRVYESPGTSEVSAEFRDLDDALCHPAREGAEMIRDGDVLYVGRNGGWVRPHLADGAAPADGVRNVRMRVSEETNATIEEVMRALGLKNKTEAVVQSVRAMAVIAKAVKAGKMIVLETADGKVREALVLEGINGRPS